MGHSWWQGSKKLYRYHYIATFCNIIYFFRFCTFHCKYDRPLACTLKPIVHPFKAQDPSISMHRIKLYHHPPSHDNISPKIAFSLSFEKRKDTFEVVTLISCNPSQMTLDVAIVFGSSPISHRVLWWFLHMVVRMGPVRFCHQTYPPLLSRLLGWPPAFRSKHSNCPKHFSVRILKCSLDMLVILNKHRQRHFELYRWTL